jgi:hypothetical protein
MYDGIVTTIPSGRMGKPEEVADVVVPRRREMGHRRDLDVDGGYSRSA